MAITQRKTSVAILGGGLAGLTCAALLEKEGIDYLLIDGQAEFGGLIQGQMEQGICLDYGLKSIPVGDVTANPLLQLNKLLNLELPIESWNLPPVVFGKNEFSEFVGFGSTKNRSLIEELSYYTSSPRLLVSGGWSKLIDQLLKIIPDSKKRTRSHVTKLEVTDNVVTSVLINGDTQLTADRFVFTFSPSALKSLLPIDAVNAKTLQRIAKTEPFTVLSLDIAINQPVSELKNIMVLNDGGDDDFYVLGQFVTNVDPMRENAGLQISTWLTLINEETTIDDEATSKVIRNMKKVIKKAFPELITKKSWERLLAVPRAIGNFDQLQLEKNGTLPGLTNLYMCGGQINGEHRNTEAAIKSAQAVASQLVKKSTSAFYKPATEIEIAEIKSTEVETTQV
ncbi:MAG: FAD-dependent oxidoreductase [Oligoflexia bacterium]|nr:FAD-dependent oxidoreductase [Oligoflexia bacterium]